LLALGTENALGFSLNFDPTILTYSSASVGMALRAAFYWSIPTTSRRTSRPGVDFFSGTFAAGTQDVVDVTFDIAVVTNSVITSITFVHNPPGKRWLILRRNHCLPSMCRRHNNRTTTLEGDVSPRPDGNEDLSIADWVRRGGLWRDLILFPMPASLSGLTARHVQPWATA